MEPTPGILVASLPAAERSAGALLAARSMRDNPMHVAALGPDGRRRVEVMRLAFEVMFASGAREVLGAWSGADLVGVAAHAPSPDCQPRAGQWLRFAPTIARAGTRTPRLVRWLAAWSRRDLATAHCHLGPVAVDERFRGMGVGSALLTRHAAELDAGGHVGYLETDRFTNVGLYRRFGFRVVQMAQVLDVPNWFMSRPRVESGS